MKIKKKDKVVVIAGEDRGKIGEVIKVFPKKRKIIVSKVNIVKKHQRPTQDNPGGIREVEVPIDVSNVMLLCPQCDQKTRVGFRILEDGKKVRICKKCKEIIE